MRQLLFSCSDPEISYSTDGLSYDKFAYDADIPHEVVYALSFCIPPFVVSLRQADLRAAGDLKGVETWASLGYVNHR